MTALPNNWPHTSHLSRRQRRTRSTWDAPRKKLLTSMWLEGQRVAEIADACSTSPGAIYVQAGKLGLPPRRKRTAPGNALPAPDATGQRRFTGVEPGKGPKISLKPWHPALRNGATIFGQLLEPAAAAKNLLRSGEWNRKIGGVAEKGRWKAMPIFTLTLEERATCPRSCLEWATCYGNNMGRAPRLIDDGWLLPRLEAELAHLDAIHSRGFIVRLHVLGDFYSLEYVRFWRRAVQRFPALRIFGFTARLPSTDIGRELVHMMEHDLDRVALRWSGAGHELHCSEVVDRREDAGGIVCPAELDATRCCATCGLCWQSERTISFLRH